MSYYTYDYIYGLKIEGSQQKKKKSKSNKQNHKIKKEQKYQLKTLVRWQGYQQNESTWEPYKNMEEDGAYEMVKKFMQEYTFQNYIKRKQHQITDTFYCDNNIQAQGLYHSIQKQIQDEPENKNDISENENNHNGNLNESHEKQNYFDGKANEEADLELNVQEVLFEMQENKDQNFVKMNDQQKNGKDSEQSQQELQNAHLIQQHEFEIYGDQLNPEKQTNNNGVEPINQLQEKNQKTKQKERKQSQIYKYDLKGGFVGQDKAVRIVSHFIGRIQSLVTQENEFNLFYEVEYGYDFDGSKIKNNYSNREMLKCFEKKLFKAYIKQFPESEDLWKEIQEENKLENLKQSRKKQRTIDSD